MSEKVTSNEVTEAPHGPEPGELDRRKLLKSFAVYALIAPPLITSILTSSSNEALAQVTSEI